MPVQEITAALQGALPPPLQGQAAPLAELLATVERGELAPEAARGRLAAEFPALLQALGGREVQTPASVISFANNDQQNATITISGNVAGRDVITGNTITLVVPIVTQHVAGNYNAVAANGGTANVTVTNYYADAPRAPDRNRKAMLQRVRAIWVAGLLEETVPAGTRISLPLMEREDAVALPLNAQVQEIDDETRVLPPDTAPIDLFECWGGALLLGGPGTGKTTLLLELARDLLARAEADENHPIPVVFNLSSWSERRSLSAWLVDELNAKYDVPRKTAEGWIATDAILLLLDGLDEVPLGARPECVEAINRFRSEHGLVPMVVACRSAEYEALPTKLRLGGAVVVQQLTQQQIGAYLERGGEGLAGLRAMMAQDETLRGLAETPLVLSIMALAYRDVPSEQFRTPGAPEQRRRHLFDTYIERMFARRGAQQPFTREQTTRWLGNLARSVQQRAEPIILVEQMQPDWLPTPPARLQYLLVDRLGWGGLFALVFGIFVGMFAWVNGERIDALLLALGSGLMAGLVVGLGSGTANGVPHIITRIKRIVIHTLVGWLVVGLLFGSALALSSGLLFDFLNGLFIGMLGALVGALSGILDIAPGIGMRRIAIVERLRWSWQKALESAFFGGLVLGVVFALIILMIAMLDLPSGFDAVNQLVRGLSYGVGGGLFIGQIFGVVFALVGGWVSGDVTTTIVPNQGIRRSARSALVYGLLVGAGVGIVVGLLFGMLVGLGVDVVSGLYVGIVIGVMVGLLAALVSGLAFGGYACLSHYALRFVLWQHGAMPFDCVGFLDHCVERILLRRVGGGYIFVNRMLLEHFASLGQQEVPQVAPTTQAVAS